MATLVIAWPGMSTLALRCFITAWMLVMGVFQMAYAIRVRTDIANEVRIIFPVFSRPSSGSPSSRFPAMARSAWSG